ncbi:LysR substrate-binding domain-containing protein [Bosea sp. (in: a-proteobacteria)]|jgi:LysR family glycine cleavage system transcriptional activator|uniref:LysR substrate-binding domain-containing protein n=1 Tax=Bosea sp. (in: a-proteobacteria) TaxID=1871050 RepID=UPI002DDDA091|nr:LysR substrate-binding domain-containing protein [Bosea sp. (in: a-proteobacteria)]HEV2508241.1 LysR substrate-binding domain-containing protein [Bosea sp. (in: a-proteobacteria)]
MNDMVTGLPPLSAVRAFEAAARHGSFTRAAAELGMTQAAVSYQIKLLEERLGLALFQRQARRVVLTEAGERLAISVTDAFDGLRGAFAAVTETAEGVLSIQAMPTLASNWLAPRLGLFQCANPSLAIRLVPRAAPAELEADDCDVVIRRGGGQWPGLEAHWLMTNEYSPLCGPGLFRHLGRAPEPSDLLTVPRFGCPKSWASWFAAAGISSASLPNEPRIDLVVQQYEVTAALAGNGAVMAQPAFFRRELNQGVLVQPFDVMLRDGQDYWLTYPARRRSSRKIRLFRDWLLKEARDG